MSKFQNGAVGSISSTAPHQLPVCQQAVVLFAWSLVTHLSAVDQPFSAFALYLSCIALTQKPWEPVANLTCNCIALQGFQTVLVDLLVDLSAQACVTADSDSYLHGHLGDSLQERLPRLLASILGHSHVGQYAPTAEAVLCAARFLALCSKLCGGRTSGHDALEGRQWPDETSHPASSIHSHARYDAHFLYMLFENVTGIPTKRVLSTLKK